MGGKCAHSIERPWYWKKNDYFEVYKGMDWPSVRRGRQVYTEVFAPCHSLDGFTFNHFQAFMTKEEIKKLAASYEIVDEEPGDDGSQVIRPGKPIDKLPAPYPNTKAAAFANNGAEPPSLTLIHFARHSGSDYVFSLLTGYSWGQGLFQIPPWLGELKPGQFFNPYMKGGIIAMPPPLSDGMLEYEDGTPATVSQMAKDVVNFLRWSAEPDYDMKRLYFWKGLSTLLIITTLFVHQGQKHMGSQIFRRTRFRYWGKASYGGFDAR